MTSFWKVFLFLNVALGILFIIPNFFDRLSHRFQKVKDVLKGFQQKKEGSNVQIKVFEKLDFSIPYLHIVHQLLLSPQYTRSLSKRSGIYFSYETFMSCCFISFILTAPFFVYVFIYNPLHLGVDYFLRIFLTIFLSLVGFYLPHIIFYSMIKKRIRILDKEMPMFIDLMLVCLDAGLTIRQTILTVAEEFKNTSPIIAHEFEKTHHELSLFLDQKVAFLDLVERVPSKRLREFISIILTNQEKGGSIYETLSKMSVSVYKDQMQSIEEKAQKLPGVLSAFIAIFTLPMIFIVTFGPYAKGLMVMFS